VFIEEFRTNHRAKHVANLLETSAHTAHKKRLASSMGNIVFIEI